MSIATARVPTVHGGRYLQQLCRHWGHRLDVELSARAGVVRFPDAVARMEAEADALAIQVEAADAATAERVTGVVARHLDRLAFREAPLRFHWAAR